MTVKLTKEQSHLTRLALEGYANGLSFQPRKRAKKIQTKVETLMRKFPFMSNPTALSGR